MNHDLYWKEMMVSVSINITIEVESAEQPDIPTMSAVLIHHHHVTLRYTLGIFLAVEVQV